MDAHLGVACARAPPPASLFPGGAAPFDSTPPPLSALVDRLDPHHPAPGPHSPLARRQAQFDVDLSADFQEKRALEEDAADADVAGVKGGLEMPAAIVAGPDAGLDADVRPRI